MRSSIHATMLVSALSLPLIAAACGGAPTSARPEEATGTVNVAITTVPANVACIEIDVTGMNDVTARFDVKAGVSSVLPVAGVPLGNVDITGSAWNGPCSNIGAPATWSAQSVPATIPTSGAASVGLTFFAVASVTVGVDFESETYRNVTTFAGTAQQAGTTDGVGAAARFSRPQQLANDGTNLYVADGKNLTIRKVVIATGAVSTLAGNPAATGVGVNGVGTAATFNHPEGLALDGAGNLFVTDTVDNVVRKIVLATGAVTTLAGAAGQTGSADGTGAAATFSTPYGIAADGHGNLFVADSQNTTIRQIVIATGAVTTLAGLAGQAGALDGIAGAARFQQPAGIATDGTSLYVSDGSAIRQVQIATGRVWTMLGAAGTQGVADGFTPRFGAPYGVAFDAAGGNLFITDASYYDVRQYSFATGLVTTPAGSPGAAGAVDGNGPVASFRLPLGVTVDPKGTVYVSDTANNTIRKM